MSSFGVVCVCVCGVCVCVCGVYVWCGVCTPCKGCGVRGSEDDKDGCVS